MIQIFIMLIARILLTWFVWVYSENWKDWLTYAEEKKKS